MHLTAPSGSGKPGEWPSTHQALGLQGPPGASPPKRGLGTLSLIVNPGIIATLKTIEVQARPAVGLLLGGAILVLRIDPDPGR